MRPSHPLLYPGRLPSPRACSTVTPLVTHVARAATVFGLCLLAVGCGQENETGALRALQPSGDVSIVCLERGSDGRFTEGRDRRLCPDYENVASDELEPDERHMMALVTQPDRGEVALVDLNESVSDAVLDFEPTQPGYSFLPVGADPGTIVSTSGGVASFVTVRDPGREGVFALPSSCIAPRAADGALRDVRTWPACRLPTTPGEMVLLTDPALDHDQDVATPPRVRERCAADYVDADELVGAAPGAARTECPADLALEGFPLGRRKLAVALPSRSEIWVLDAQELLDRAPGSFADCVPEATVPLAPQVADQQQRLPADLVPSSPSCAPIGVQTGPLPSMLQSWPIDLALDDESRLYVADSQAPVIHRLDVSDPCAPTALAPLLPMSYSDPRATITTRKVAVSPLTSAGQRFVYAVDDSATGTGGTLMAFDVSAGSTDRTPLLRERAPYSPWEPPDRIVLPRPVGDVEFGFQDVPLATNDGIAVEGIACDPDPSVPLDSPAARYRTRPDRSGGARPTRLRGTFAYAALHSGQLAVIDVDDIDAACRRPGGVNPLPIENLLGCKNDDPNALLNGGYFLNNTPTVSDELSCNVVVPHRARSRSFFSNSLSQRSAALLSFPTLTLPTGRTVSTDQSEEGKDQPKMLGARFSAGEAAELSVGALRYETDSLSDPLELDPALTERSSVLLSYEEPRAYSPGEEFVATYEGVITAPVGQAIFRAPADGSSYGLLDGGLNASLCSAGIQDVDLTRDVGASMGVSDPAVLARFAQRHADYVQITASLLEEDHPYWQPGSRGAECGAELFDGGDSSRDLRGRALCDNLFGSPQADLPARDLRIVAASEDGLLLEPRVDRQSDNRRQRVMQFVSCCFPEPTAYVVRAGHQWVVRGDAIGVAHHVRPDPVTRRCVNDCNPLTQRLTSRVFEISCSGNCPIDSRNATAAGRAVPGQDFVCIVDDTAGGVEPGEPGSECIYQSLTTRFAIYRGQEATDRDTRFRWVTSDGFVPLTVSLASAERSRSYPRGLRMLPELGLMLITDGSVPGLTTVQLTSLNLTTNSIF